jgi:hypothetical protein
MLSVFLLQEAHIAKLQGALDAGGDASLQNAMNLAIESLRSIPPYGHREVLLLLHSSAMSCELLTVTPRSNWPARQAGQLHDRKKDRLCVGAGADPLCGAVHLRPWQHHGCCEGRQGEERPGLCGGCGGRGPYLPRLYKGERRLLCMRTWFRALLHSRTGKKAWDPLGHLSLLMT